MLTMVNKMAVWLTMVNEKLTFVLRNYMTRSGRARGLLLSSGSLVYVVVIATDFIYIIWEDSKKLNSHL